MSRAGLRQLISPYQFFSLTSGKTVAVTVTLAAAKGYGYIALVTDICRTRVGQKGLT
jgi:hypothetical protein